MTSNFVVLTAEKKHEVLKQIDPHLRSEILPFLIPQNMLQRGSKIGQGHFGVVFKGTLYDNDAGTYSAVAIKSFGGKRLIEQNTFKNDKLKQSVRVVTRTCTRKF